MPPSVHKLTPFEKRLRRIEFWARLGHDVTAPNCYWARPQDLLAYERRSKAGVCAPCVELREKMP